MHSELFMDNFFRATPILYFFTLLMFILCVLSVFSSSILLILSQNSDFFWPENEHLLAQTTKNKKFWEKATKLQKPDAKNKFKGRIYKKKAPMGRFTNAFTQGLNLLHYAVSLTRQSERMDLSPQ